ncbi:MAG: hypothetical protein OXC95_02110 [Dehalococcoidia bacterium]|nr:hypothetical protein [Dehalococcoidia bacterium]
MSKSEGTMNNVLEKFTAHAMRYYRTQRAKRGLRRYAGSSTGEIWWGKKRPVEAKVGAVARASEARGAAGMNTGLRTPGAPDRWGLKRTNKMRGKIYWRAPKGYAQMGKRRLLKRGRIGRLNRKRRRQWQESMAPTRTTSAMGASMAQLRRIEGGHIREGRARIRSGATSSLWRGRMLNGEYLRGYQSPIGIKEGLRRLRKADLEKLSSRLINRAFVRADRGAVDHDRYAGRAGSWESIVYHRKMSDKRRRQSRKFLDAAVERMRLGKRLPRALRNLTARDELGVRRAP